MKQIVLGALIAALIGFGTAVIALLTQEGVTQLSDISTISWIVVAIGAGLNFLKDFQAVTTRKLFGGDSP